MQTGTTLKFRDFSVVNVHHKTAIDTLLRVLFFFFFSWKWTSATLTAERHILGWHVLLALTWTYPDLIMHSSIEGYPDYFKLLTIMDSAAVPKFIFVCVWAWVFQSSFLNTGSTIVGSQGEVCLALEKTAQLCYNVAVRASHQQ